jgi:hypothetical protein
MKRNQRGQSMVEATLVLLVFFTLLLGVIDCGQVLFAHESLVERVRSAVRWGVVHPWNQKTGSEPVVNLVLYNQTETPRGNVPTFLGLQREDVVVRHQAPSADRPDDETLRVTIVNFRSQFFSPWIGRAVVSPRAVSITAPMASRQALSSVQTNYPQP